MSEPGFREIQLNTKQVVFLFIAVVTAAVGIFLLGVSVGKGVAPDRPGEMVQATDPAADVTASGAMPPATSPKPDELKYHDELQKGGRGGAAPPTPADVPPDSAAKPAPTATPTLGATATPAPSAKPTSKPAPPAASASAEYYVQVDSFGLKANAERQIGQLKAKGISAFIFEAPGPGAKFKVRVGPFADRPAAETMQARLRKEKFSPTVIR
jgi:cell division septation protein DedD